MSDKSIMDRVKGHISSSKDIELVDIVGISSDAVVVYDNWKEYDVYFDVTKYTIIHPEIWTGPSGDPLVPDTLRGTGLGVLPGLGRFPRINSFEDAMEFAQHYLTPKSDASRWYDSLQV